MGALGVALAGDPRFGGDEGPRYPSSTSHHLIVPAPCRLCAGPSYLTDELGAIHGCCQLMWDGRRCLACDTSEALNREHRRRGSRPGWKEIKGEGDG